MLNLRRPTLKDIAAKAGVSIATVSNVLSGRVPVRERTREKVLKAVSELGYEPVSTIHENTVKRFVTIIGLSMPHFYTQGMKVIAEAVKERACELGMQVIEYLSDNDAQKQIAQISEKVMRRVDVVICFPVNGREIRQSVEECNRHGIPFISLNRISEGNVTATIKSNDYQAGNNLGLFTAFYLLRNNREGKILHLQGDPADFNALQRSKGFEDMVCCWPHLEIVHQERCYWDPERAKEVVERLLRERSDINVIFAESDEMAQSAFSVLEKMGKLFPIDHPQHVLLMGVDGNKFALAQIRKGLYSATAEQILWEQGRKAAELALEALNGTLQKGFYLEMPTILVTRENVDFIKNHWAEKEG